MNNQEDQEPKKRLQERLLVLLAHQKKYNEGNAVLFAEMKEQAEESLREQAHAIFARQKQQEALAADNTALVLTAVALAAKANDEAFKANRDLISVLAHMPHENERQEERVLALMGNAVHMAQKHKVALAITEATVAAKLSHLQQEESLGKLVEKYKARDGVDEDDAHRQLEFGN
jgi:hypothetical protein